MTLQFDVYRSTDAVSKSGISYLVDLQADLLEHLQTRVVAPLISLNNIRPIDEINPVVSLNGNPFVVSIAEVAGVSIENLGEKVGSLAHYRNEIVAAVDFLFTGI